MSGLSRRTVILTALVGLLVLGVPGLGYFGYRGYEAYAAAQSGVFPASTSVSGVDVSGMTRREATRAVRAKVTKGMDREATVKVGDRTYTVTPRELGADADVSGAMGKAVRRAQQVSWWERFTGDANGPDVTVSTSGVAKKQITELVDTMVRRAHEPARDASVELVGGAPEISQEEAGQGVDRKAVRKALRSALASGGTRKVEVHTIEPDVTSAAFDTIIVVDDGTNVLRLYEGGELTETYNVAMGQPGHRTPHGRFEVTLKRPDPVWVNPAPNGWGKDMPARLGPGPGSPLGVAALNISSPGIRIHGTSAASSIGNDASHGCIRLHNSQILDLYPQVPTGAEVFITG